MAHRIERIRGLRFRQIPRVEVLQPGQLVAVARRLRARALVRIESRPEGLTAFHRHSAALRGFETLAGLLPQATATDAGAGGTSEQIGGAYDYSRDRIILIDRIPTTRADVQRILAHELTHALEDQNFRMRFATSRGPGQAAQARRALIEGTATFVAARYDGLYLHNQLAIGIRLAGQRSVFEAGGSIPFAVKTNTVFDYVDGPVFVQRLYRKAHGWRLVNEALRHPPATSRVVLHPSIWPRRGPDHSVRLRLGSLLAAQHRLAGGGVAGEEDLVGLLASGAPDTLADAAGNVWRGGRFQLWRLRHGSCDAPCPNEDVGVMAIRLGGAREKARIGDAFFQYALLARLGQRLTAHTWRFLDGQYGSLHFGPRSLAIAFAPGQALAGDVAREAARQASRG